MERPGTLPRGGSVANTTSSRRPRACDAGSEARRRIRARQPRRGGDTCERAQHRRSGSRRGLEPARFPADATASRRRATDVWRSVRERDRRGTRGLGANRQGGLAAGQSVAHAGAPLRFQEAHMSRSKVRRIARYFHRDSARDDDVTSGETSISGDSFSDVLRTGSMLSFGAALLDDAPRRLGSYRILERIGEGGMGVVYLAEQDPPLVRHVAIKLARSAVPGDRALARLESERQTLAVMKHPNIAQVLDAGSAPDSRPYFVMEHVAGKSIIEFCDAKRLGIEPRLELFVRVCDGVQHAHVNAIIHRDLKPSNILVTTESGSPTPKIIDFRLAKAFEGGPGPRSGLTQFGQIIGTPEYMSPEQAALDGRPVDTRTDVYSLGVVFYELLAGGRPFEQEEGPDASFVDLCRRIREEDPERPSARVVRTADFEAARRRGLVPQTLVRRLRGDLDAIAIKALAKDPAGRYATPSDMAAD